MLGALCVLAVNIYLKIKHLRTNTSLFSPNNFQNVFPTAL